MKIGSLVKIIGEEDLNNHIIAWYETEDDIKIQIFETSCLYGIFLGNPINSNNKLWYKVLIENRIYMFLMTDLQEIE